MSFSMVTLVLSAFILMRLVTADLSQQERTNLEMTVRELMRCTNISALSISLVSIDKRVNYMKGFEGIGHRGQDSVNFRSVFCIGGGTQAFTAVLLGILIDSNDNVTWDTPIQNIVGHRIALPDRYLSENLNLKDILAMRSGLAGMEIVPMAKPYTAERLVSNLRYAPRVGGFRDNFVYNEVLFSLLAEVFQVLGKDTWQNLIRRHILEPLHMKSTTFIGTSQLTNNPDLVKGTEYYGSKPYTLDNSVYSGLELVAPAASLCTTAEDMSKWHHFLLAGGQIGSNRLIRKEALEMTYAAIQPRGQEDDPVIQGYRQPLTQSPYTRDHNSLGWINGYYRGQSFISQDGALPGFQSLATIIPSSKVAAFVAFSGDKHEKRFLAKVLLNIFGIDLLLQDSQWITQYSICTLVENVPRSNRQTRKDDRFRNIVRAPSPGPRPLEDYAGLFQNYAYGDIDVKFNATGDGSLVLTYGLATYRLEPTNKNDTFQLIAQAGSLWYSTNVDWYRDNQRLIAVFSFDSHDPEQRIRSISIDGFDKHHVPEFIKDAPPPENDELVDDQRCSSTSLKAWQWFILTFITFSISKFLPL